MRLRDCRLLQDRIVARRLPRRRNSCTVACDSLLHRCLRSAGFAGAQVVLAGQQNSKPQIEAAALPAAQAGRLGLTELSQLADILRVGTRLGHAWAAERRGGLAGRCCSCCRRAACNLACTLAASCASACTHSTSSGRASRAAYRSPDWWKPSVCRRPAASCAVFKRSLSRLHHPACACLQQIYELDSTSSKGPLRACLVGLHPSSPASLGPGGHCASRSAAPGRCPSAWPRVQPRHRTPTP